MLGTHEKISKFTFRTLILIGVEILVFGTLNASKADNFLVSEKVATSSISTIKKVRNKAMPQIIEQIKKKDWTFTEEEIHIDPSLTQTLVPLCDDEDAEIRELTLYAINSIPSELARNCIINALHDIDINVRSAASRFLRTNYSKQDVDKLHTELSVNEDEFVRESIILVLGLIGDTSSKEVIERHADAEQDANAIHAVHLAMVRLRDENHSKNYVDQLSDPDPKIRVQALEDFKYIRELGFLSYIKPLLFDKNKGKNVGPSKSKIWLRVCDVTVNVLDKVLNHPFSFEVTELKNFTSQELSDADKVIQRMLP